MACFRTSISYAEDWGDFDALAVYALPRDQASGPNSSFLPSIAYFLARSVLFIHYA